MKMRPILLTLIVFVLQAVLAVGASAQAAEGRHWVTAWAMSPSTLSPAADADAAFTSDNLHPNDAGYQAMASAIDLDIFR